ncbi:3-hydroxyisobutyrate dehydrogenase b [Oncorhynchus tshawytscha]|uniref:3-hydroxyisobutyrate dehydrogenase n=2 Tax=Oncorhynchus TaxID=8016 RepID=A0A8C7NC53_ONCKI|nr:3-hydroxyisobutyrate dehydrogenase, mitochondrial-like [Oncorhynchus kisutch]XP_024262583.1 3-hydroxyisobutyrate dehydrogenase b [Oncorhynchus tshawytscha]
MAAVLRGSRNLWGRSLKHVDFTLVSSRSMASKTQVGFIGLGNMGKPMAKNLLKHGYPVIATDVFPESCKELQELGAQIVDNPAEVADQADRVVTMLPSSPNVIEVYTGPNGILKKVKKGSLLIDSSTIDPAVSKEMAVAAEKMGAVFMDAPVSGGVGAASSGKLTFMVGGVEEEFTAAQELLTCMGANVVYCGAVGTGQAAKICNNMLLAIGMIGTSETMNLGIRLGLDPKLLAKILNMSSGRCWSSDTYNPVPGVMEGVPSGNNYQGGFGTQLMAKDLGLAQTTATNTKTPVPLGSLAHQIYRMMCARGYSGKDFSSVFQFLREDEENEGQ